MAETELVTLLLSLITMKNSRYRGKDGGVGAERTHTEE